MTEPTNADIRAWAREHGHAVADRGRVPSVVVAAYAVAHRSAPPAEDELAYDEPAYESPAYDAPGEQYAHPPAHDQAAEVPAYGEVGRDEPATGWPAPEPPSNPSPWEARGPAWGAPPTGPPPPPPSSPPPSSPPPAWGANAPGHHWDPNPPKQGTDGLAVAALVLGLVPFCGLLGIVFGIVALSRVRKTGQGGRGMAIAGIVLGSIWILVGSASAVVNVLAEADRDGRGSVTSRGTVPLDDLRVGDCLSSVPDGAVRTVKVVPCAEPHRGEVYGAFKLSGPSFPGEAEVTRFANGGCDERLNAFVGPANSDALTFVYISPTAATWRQGDRDVTCVLTMISGVLPGGSAKAP